VFTFSNTSTVWWNGLAEKMCKLRNLAVWQFNPAEVKALGMLADRAMQLQITLQDGVITVDGGGQSAELVPTRLNDTH
jgi:uncharacterized protein YaeQ